MAIIVRRLHKVKVTVSYVVMQYELLKKIRDVDGSVFLYTSEK